jgi:hypothetical protein
MQTQTYGLSVILIDGFTCVKYRFAKPHHFDAAPAPDQETQKDAAPSPFPSLISCKIANVINVYADTAQTTRNDAALALGPAPQLW